MPLSAQPRGPARPKGFGGDVPRLPAFHKRLQRAAQADSAGCAGDDGDGLLGCIHTMMRVSVDIIFFKNELLRMYVRVLRTIELEALQIFKAVVDYGGVTRAATQLHRVPSKRYDAVKTAGGRPKTLLRLWVAIPVKRQTARMLGIKRATLRAWLNTQIVAIRTLVLSTAAKEQSKIINWKRV
jgi:hypothetical protein